MTVREKTKRIHQEIKDEYRQLIGDQQMKRKDAEEILAGKFFLSWDTIHQIVPPGIRPGYKKHIKDVGKDLKTCSKCGLVKPVSEFYTHEGTADGLFGSCKVCQNEYMAKWNADKKTKF